MSLALTFATSIFSMTYSNAASMYGDLNQDGSIDAIDYALMKGYILSGTELPKPSLADLDADGNINAIDYSLLKQYLLNMIDKFPAGNTTEVKKTEAEKLVGDIIFSVPSSTFKTSLSVLLSSEISNAEIRYTTDGKIPTLSSTIYNSALTLTKTTQVRAQAFVNGEAIGTMGTAVYVCSSIDATHDLPIVIIDSYGAGKPGKTDYLDAAIMLMEPKNNQTSLLQAPTFATRGGYHVRGQSSANFEKTPYRLELWDNEGGDAKYPIMGMAADGDWCLLSPYPDKSLIRNAFAYEVGKTLGLETPGYSFVEVYINTDNQPLSANDYQGVYLLTEKIEIDKDRLNIKKLKKDDLSEPDISGGYLMQFNMMSAEDPIIKGNGWSDLELTEPSDALPEQLAWITNYIQNTHNAIHSSNPSDSSTGYPAYIDVDSFVDFIIINEMARQGDSYMRSTRIFKDRNEKLKAGPLWDFDLGFNCYTGMGFGGSNSTVEGWQFQPMFGGVNSTVDWYYTLMKDPSFQQKIAARWSSLRSGPLSDANLTALIKQLSAPLNNGAKRNFQKWNILNTSSIGGFNTQTTQTWEQQITILQDFVLKRAAWLDKSGWKPTTNNTNPWGW